MLSDPAELQGWFAALRMLSDLVVSAKLLSPNPRVEDSPLSVRMGWLVDVTLSDAHAAPVYLRQWPARDWPPLLHCATRALLGSRLAEFVPVAHLWIGPRGVHTPTHADDEHNLIIQLHGRKEVLLWPPWTRDSRGPPLGAEKAYSHDHLVLGAGDILLLPKGWAHSLTAVDGAVSLNIWHPRAHLVFGEPVLSCSPN